MSDRPVTPEQTIQRLRESPNMPTLEELDALLDVAEAADDLHHALAFQEHDPGSVTEASGRVGEALERLARGASR